MKENAVAPVATSKLRLAIAALADPKASVSDAVSSAAALVGGPWLGLLVKFGWSLVGSIVANHKAETFSEENLEAGVAANLAKPVYSFNAATLFPA